MKNRSLYILVSLTLTMFSYSLGSQELSNRAALKAEAQDIAKKFSHTLKPKLQQAIQSGGLAHAINICAIQAPKIAQELSEQTGWDIKRVSLKPRNKNSATPDPFEKNILAQFNQEQAKPASTLLFDQLNNNEYKFMKAQRVTGVCLNCHGTSLKNEVKEALKKHYKDDVATGYSLGQIRGAISLVKRL